MGFGKVAQMQPTGIMRDTSGNHGFYVVLMSVRIYKIINKLTVARVRSSFAGRVLGRADLGCAVLGWAGLTAHLG